MTSAVIVMGVSGCGKSTLGVAIAARLGRSFVEGDDCHPGANVARMSGGLPLSDADRRPFLLAVADRLAANPTGAVASCSGLTRDYRDLIRGRVGDVLFVLPTTSIDVLAGRMRRREHFMPASLLASQFEVLEPPHADERSMVLDACWPTHHQVDMVCATLVAT